MAHGLNPPAVCFSLLSLWLICVLWFQVYPGYQADYLEHRLRALRARVFDLAAGGKVAFESAAFAELLRMLEAGIGGARTFTSWTVLLWCGCARQAEVGSVETADRKDVLDLEAEMRACLLRYLARTSALYWVCRPFDAALGFSSPAVLRLAVRSLSMDFNAGQHSSAAPHRKESR